MNNPWNIIQELEDDNSRLAKEAIVAREADAGRRHSPAVSRADACAH